ncbi:MAG: hypothetical protein AAF125_26230, partial [Chloroflexota bacterium]
MRHLHPIAAHEVLVASGTYRHFNNNEPTGLLEHWAIHELPDGAWFIRVDRDGRAFDGRSEFIEAWRSPVPDGGLVERFDVVGSGAPSDDPRQGRATFTLEGNHVHIGRTIGRDERQQETVEVPSGTLLQPGTYVCFGLIMPMLVENAPQPMFWRTGLHVPNDAALTGSVTYPSITFYRDEGLEVDGRERETKRYMSRAGDATWHYYWLDANNTFLRHEGGDMVVQLERYSHRIPSPPTNGSYLRKIAL